LEEEFLQLGLAVAGLLGHLLVLHAVAQALARILKPVWSRARPAAEICCTTSRHWRPDSTMPMMPPTWPWMRRRRAGMSEVVPSSSCMT
jgi:hypothetical protein